MKDDRVHDYLGINLVRVWEIVERDLHVLKAQVEALLARAHGSQ